MDALLILLPTEVTACELFPFLSTRDLTALDAAVTNHLLRPQLFHIYQSPLCVRHCDCGLTSRLLTWFIDRSITLTAITLSKDLDSNGLSDIYQQLCNNEATAASIKHLDVSPCNATANSKHIVKLLSCCHGLESVNLSLCRQVTKVALTKLGQKCPHLRSLDLSITRVTTKALISMAKNCPSLTSLNLRACTLVTDDAIISLSKSCPALRYLDISLSGPGVTDAAVIALSQNCPSLTKLNMSVCNITDSAVSALARNCSAIESIDLSYCYSITDAGVANLARGRSAVRALSLRGNNKITDASVMTLVQNCPSLVSTEVNFCPQITESANEVIYECCSLNRGPSYLVYLSQSGMRL